MATQPKTTGLTYEDLRSFPDDNDTVQMSSLPARALTNASVFPSGDQAGLPSNPAVFVICRGAPPCSRWV